MKRITGLIVLLSLSVSAQPLSFQERKRTVIDVYAHPKGSGDSGYATIAAKLWRHEDAEWCSRRLEQLLAPGPSGDMFWMFPVTAIAYVDRGQLSDSARQALRRSFKTYMPYRGDTENHWLLYYTCLYLMAQMWPDQGGTQGGAQGGAQGGEQWYTGKSSAENLRESAEWIESWVRLTTTRGQG